MFCLCYCLGLGNGMIARELEGREGEEKDEG